MHSIIVKNTLVTNKYVIKFAIISHILIIGEFIIFIIIQEPEIIDRECLFSVKAYRLIFHNNNSQLTFLGWEKQIYS